MIQAEREIAPLPAASLLVRDATLALTCVPVVGDLTGRLEGASIAVADERILAIGPMEEIVRRVDVSRAQVVDARGKIVAPGFVDSHTHLVFGGSRVQEYAAQMTRMPEEVAAMGIPTGILATVMMTRQASFEELTSSASRRLQGMLAHGATTVESKSGYGLTLDDELKLLEINHHLGSQTPIDIISTFMGAHTIPPELSHRHYVDLVIQEMIPAVAERRLAKFCDVFCEEGYFTLLDTQRILEAARTAGLDLKVHADQYSNLGASRLAAEMGAVSADHLNYTGRDAMHKLAEANVIAVIMPLIDFAVQHPRPFDARAMLEEGLTLALATDLCPGCWAESLQLAMQFVCRIHHISPEEALYAATVGGALALGLDDRGSLEVGKLADLQIWDLPTFEDVIYRLGHNPVTMVIKRGVIAYPNDRHKEGDNDANH